MFAGRLKDTRHALAILSGTATTGTGADPPPAAAAAAAADRYDSISLTQIVFLRNA